MGKNLYRNFLKENEWSNIRLVKKPKKHIAYHAKGYRVYNICVTNMDDIPSVVNIDLEVYNRADGNGIDITKFRIDLQENYNTRVYSYDIQQAAFISDGSKVDIIYSIYLENEQFNKFNLSLRERKLKRLMNRK